MFKESKKRKFNASSGDSEYNMLSLKQTKMNNQILTDNDDRFHMPLLTELLEDPKFTTLYKIGTDFSAAYDVLLDEVLRFLFDHYILKDIPEDITQRLCAHFRKEVTQGNLKAKLKSEAWVLVAYAGAGKSTLTNRLLDERLAIENNSHKSQDSPPKAYKIPDTASLKNCFVIDTPGLNDTWGKSDNQIINEIEIEIVKNLKQASQINGVFLLWAPARQGKFGWEKATATLVKSFGEEILKSLIILINKEARLWNEEVHSQWVEGLISEVRSDPRWIPKIILKDVVNTERETLISELQAEVKNLPPFNEEKFELHRKRIQYKIYLEQKAAQEEEKNKINKACLEVQKKFKTWLIQDQMVDENFINYLTTKNQREMDEYWKQFVPPPPPGFSIYSVTPERKDTNKLAICISGYLSQQQDHKKAWTDLILNHPDQNFIVVDWEASSCLTEILNAGKMIGCHLLETWAMGEDFGVRRSFEAGLDVGLEQPNRFQKTEEKAKVAGEFLGEMLYRHQEIFTQKDIEIRFFSFSLGTVVVTHMMKALAQQLQKLNRLQETIKDENWKQFDTIKEIFFFAGAAKEGILTEEEISTINSRVINVYSENDFVLDGLLDFEKRIARIEGFAPIGTRELKGSERIENHKCEYGHCSYRGNMASILAKIRSEKK